MRPEINKLLFEVCSQLLVNKIIFDPMASIDFCSKIMCNRFNYFIIRAVYEFELLQKERACIEVLTNRQLAWGGRSMRNRLVRGV